MSTPPESSPPEHPLQSAEHDRRIDYVELPATDIQATAKFYGEAFGWKFTDYGPDYTSFEDGRSGRRLLPGRQGDERWSADRHLRRRPGGRRVGGDRRWRRDREARLRLPRRPAVPLHRSERERAGRLVGPVGKCGECGSAEVRTPRTSARSARTPALPHSRTPALPHSRTPALPHSRTPALPAGL